MIGSRKSKALLKFIDTPDSEGETAFVTAKTFQVAPFKSRATTTPKPPSMTARASTSRLAAPPRSAAEVNWLLSHQNVLNLLGHLGEDRLIQIRYEDLVTEPEKTMRRLARFLKIEYQDSLLDPYTGDRMTKYSSGRIGGDKKFHLRRSIDRSGADGARRLPEDGQLLPETVGLARSFGYTDL